MSGFKTQKGEEQIAEKQQQQKCSKSLVIEEIQIKTT